MPAARRTVMPVRTGRLPLRTTVEAWSVRVGPLRLVASGSRRHVAAFIPVGRSWRLGWLDFNVHAAYVHTACAKLGSY